jgi:hypothetical protein
MGVELGVAGIASLIGTGVSLFSALAGGKQQAPAVQAPSPAPAPAQSPVISAQRKANEAANSDGAASTDLTGGLLTPESLKVGKGTLLGS